MRTDPGKDSKSSKSAMLKKIHGNNTLYEQVVEQIKTLIEQGVYRKGDMLPSEKELIEMTGVSRITVREALKTLAEVGMIETRKGKGSFVLVDAADLKPSETDRRKQVEFRELFLNSTKARLILEPGIAKAAAEEATEEDLNKIFQTLTAGNRLHAAVDVYDGFHHAVAMATHNPQLLGIVENILETERKYQEQYQTVLYLATPNHQKRIADELVRQHYQIYEAIKNRNVEFAYFYMTEHLSYVLHSYEEYFDRFLAGPECDSKEKENINQI